MSSVDAIARADLLVTATLGHPPFTLNADVRFPAGQVVGVLGPNGAGKTTLLRGIAGLAPVRSGRIRLGERTFDDEATGEFVTPQERRVGVVFQDYRLFPRMSVRDNVAFGLRASGRSRSYARAVADTWLARVGLAEIGERRPGALSGGQAQRVALARALATDPEVLLLDEPLAALDAGTRAATRSWLRSHLAEVTGPVVVVTHDPLEAMVLTDQLVVLDAGRVVQQGTPAEVARRPAGEWVATLLGLNFYRGHLDAATGTARLDGGGHLVTSSSRGLDSMLDSGIDAGLDAGLDSGLVAGLDSGLTSGPVLVTLSPSAVTVHTSKPHDASPRNIWPGRITHLEALGGRVRLDVAGEPSALVDLTAASVAELGLGPGVPVWLSAKATEVEVYRAAPSRNAEAAGAP